MVRAEIMALIGACDAPRGHLDGSALATLGIDLDEVRRASTPLERTWAGCTPVAPRLKKALELAVRETGESPLRSEHVLLGLASVEDCVAAQILTAHGINEAEVRAALNRVLPG